MKSKKWLGKTLNYEHCCYSFDIHRWTNYDDNVIVITKANNLFCAEITLRRSANTIYSPDFKTERGARKYVERELEALRWETTQLLEG